MSRKLTTVLLCCVAALMLAACHLPRKASERACRKAERHLARAVWLCPDILRHDSASVTFTLPGDSTATTLSFTDPVVDSVMAACEQLREALAAERDLYLAALALQTERLRTQNTIRDTVVASRPRMPDPTTVRLQEFSRQAIEKLREDVCAFEPFSFTAGICTCSVRPGKNGPLITMTQAEVKKEATAPCPPQIGSVPCPEPGVAAWYRWAFWVLLAIVIGSIVLRRVNGALLSIRTSDLQG